MMSDAKSLRDAIAERIVIIDGAMGTMVQKYNLKAVSYTHLTLPTIYSV